MQNSLLAKRFIIYAPLPKLTNPNPYSYNIGYIYSFVAAGLFYWAFNRFFPHMESIMDHPVTGEDIVAANDAKNVAERRAHRTERKPSIVTKIFEV